MSRSSSCPYMTAVPVGSAEWSGNYDDIRPTQEASIPTDPANVRCPENKKGGQRPPFGKRQMGGRDQGRCLRCRQTWIRSRRTEVDSVTRMQFMKSFTASLLLRVLHLSNQRTLPVERKINCALT